MCDDCDCDYDAAIDYYVLLAATTISSDYPNYCHDCDDDDDNEEYYYDCY